MQNRATKKTNIIAGVALALILVLISLMFVLPSLVVSGADVKTSKVYKSSDNVKYKGTDAGTEATLTDRESGSFSINNKLYMKKLGEKFFSIDFEIKSADFEKFTLTFSTKNAEDETNAEAVLNRVEIVNEDGKIEARGISGLLTDSDQKAVEMIKTEKNFENAKIKLTYDSDLQAFKIKIDANEYLLNSGTNVVKFEKDEAELKFTFDGIEDEKTAKVLITNIDGQSMVEGTNGIADTVEPIIVVEDGVYNLKANTDRMLVGTRTEVKLPVRIYDLLQTATNNHTVSVKYGTDEAKDITGAATFFAEKGGDIDVTLKVKTGDANKTVDKAFKFVAEVDDAKPNKPDMQEVTKTFAAAGTEYSIAKPNISDAKGFDTKENVDFTLWYKTPTSTEWTKSTGLSFTPSAEGKYFIKVQAVDKSDNLSEPSDDVAINFRDSDAPKLTISNFPKTAYIDEELSLPTGSVSDTVDSSPTKTMKVYFVTADGKEEEIELTNGRFTPEKLGTYKVVYTAKDKANFTTSETKTFSVIEDDRPIVGPLAEFFTPWTITLICIAGVSLLGIIVLLFIKPKDAKSKK